MDQMDDSLVSISVFKHEILLNPSYPNSLGILLRSIKKRVLQYGVDPDVIRQLIIPTLDLDEIINLIPNERKIDYYRSAVK